MSFIEISILSYDLSAPRDSQSQVLPPKNGKYSPIYEVQEFRLKIPERVPLFLNTDLVSSSGLLSKYQY